MNINKTDDNISLKKNTRGSSQNDNNHVTSIITIGSKTLQAKW